MRSASLILALATLCGAHVEKQFKLPDFLRLPFYDVKMEPGPLAGLEHTSADRVVSINHAGRPLICLLPETLTNATLEPLTDEKTISQARSILKVYQDTSHLHLDDVWGWNFDFNQSIVQFFPEEGPEPNIMQISSSSFQVYIGKNDDAPGHVSLDDAEPVIVDDQYMLYTRFVNGTQCDLTLEPRVANVFFACSPEADPGIPTILSIDEPYSCTYEFVVGLNELCIIDAFRAPQIPVNVIRCGINPDEVLNEPQPEDAGSEYHYVDLPAEELRAINKELNEPETPGSHVQEKEHDGYHTADSAAREHGLDDARQAELAHETRAGPLDEVSSDAAVMSDNAENFRSSQVDLAATRLAHDIVGEATPVQEGESGSEVTDNHYEHRDPRPDNDNELLGPSDQIIPQDAKTDSEHDEL